MKQGGIYQRAVKIAQKSGFLTKKLWWETICKGGQRYKQKTWLDLKKRKLFEVHPHDQALTTIILSKKIAVVPYPRVSHIHHDEAILKILLTLKEQGFLNSWVTEGELKKFNHKEFVVTANGLSAKYPDAVIDLKTSNKIFRFVIEVERVRKSNKRYREIISAYSQMKGFDGILYLCEEDAIRKAIDGCLKNHFYPFSSCPFGLGNLNEWCSDPANAGISFNGKVTTLKKIIEKISSKQMTKES
jgi:ribosomal protein S8